nr:hypothetical protein [Weeksella virosa]
MTTYNSNPSQFAPANELMGLRKGDNILIEFIDP